MAALVTLKLTTQQHDLLRQCVRRAKASFTEQGANRELSAEARREANAALMQIEKLEEEL